MFKFENREGAGACVVDGGGFKFEKIPADGAWLACANMFEVCVVSVVVGIPNKLLDGAADVVGVKLNPILAGAAVGAEPKLILGLGAAVAGIELKLIPELAVCDEACPNWNGVFAGFSCGVGC